VWVAGDNHFIRHWDGNYWWNEANETEKDLYTVWGINRLHAWAAGKDGAMLRLTGNTWNVVETGLDDLHIYDMTGTSHDDVWAVSSGWSPDRSEIMHSDGSSWSSHATFEGAAMYAIWANAVDDVWTVGHRFKHFDGSEWHDHGTEDRLHLNALWGARQVFLNTDH
jgi:hypothetical protein